MRVVGAIVAVETVVLLALTWWVATRARPNTHPRRQWGAIALLLAAQALVQAGFSFSLSSMTWRAGAFVVPFLPWLVQAARAALLLVAFSLWFGLARDALGMRARRGLLVAALLVQAFGGGGLPVVGMAALFWLTSRPAWSRELSGWWRLTILVLGPLLLLLISLVPHLLVSGDRLSIQVLAFSRPWQAPLMSGSIQPALADVLRLTRPLDRIVQALADLFRAQLIVLSLRALTLPMRLYGMSLKRRFFVNHVFIRSIPSALGLITLAVVSYAGFGILQAGSARGEMERTLARASAVGASLLGDPQIARGGLDARRLLEGARVWLGPDSAGTCLVLRDGAHGASVWTAGTPDSLRIRPDSVTAGDREGLIEDGAALYLVAERATPDSSRSVAVYVPLDSTHVGALARTTGAELMLTLNRGLSSNQTSLSFVPDSSGRAPIRVASPGVAHDRRRYFFLARTYLPLGDWRAGWRHGVRGAVALELRTSWKLLTARLADVPGWLFSNALTVGLLVLLTSLIGLVEGFAVRSGKGIIQSLEEEVASLREAAARFGAGDLQHRIPVRGRDELSALAGSFNDMAASLERQRRELIEKERLEEELEVARAIQRRFLPQHSPAIPGLAVAGVSMPSREVGGDLYHYLELPGGRLALALGDVSGKGVPAALIMSNVMSALRAEAQHEGEIEKSLERINRLIADQVEPGRFVTLFYGVVDPGAGVVRYTSAGHNPVLLVSRDGGAAWMGDGGVPLGVLPTATYAAAQVALEPGDVLVAYSDGVTEAEGPGADGETELFGEERLARTVTSLRGQSVESILSGVLEAVRRFAAGRPQADDITLVVLRRDAIPLEPPHHPG